MQVPTVRSANVLYVISMALVLIGSAALALIVPAFYPGLIVRELLFILLPALIYLRIRKLPVRETLRLRWPGLAVAALSLLIGIGVWMLDAWLSIAISVLLNQLWGFETPLPPDAYPQNIGGVLLAFAGFAVAAPLCEEILFRGVIQRAYERRGARRAILVVGLLFVIYHQSLIQGLAIIPVALVLGYVAWRTNSLIPAILAHFGNNLMAALVTSNLVLKIPALDQLMVSPWLPLVGSILAAVGLWLLRRIGQPGEAPEPEPTSWLARVWPLALAAPIWLFSVGAEVLISAAPEVMLLATQGQPVEYEAAPWQSAQRWRYEIRSRDDKAVGEADCTLTPDGDSVVLECTMSQSAYEVQLPGSYYSGGAARQQQTIRWDAATMQLQSAHVEGEFNGQPYRLDITPTGSGLSASGSSAEGEFAASDFPPDSLLAGGGLESDLMIGEWPWRFSALPFSLLYGREVPAIQFTASGLEDGSEQPIGFLVRSSEPLATSAGDFVTWKVNFGETITAWYDVNAPHTLVQFDDGMVQWLLVE